MVGFEICRLRVRRSRRNLGALALTVLTWCACAGRLRCSMISGVSIFPIGPPALQYSRAMSLDHRVAVVTGAARGVGVGVGVARAREGARLTTN